MYISAFPTLALRRLLTGRRPKPTPFPFSRSINYYRGANAIFHGMRSLGIAPTKHVLVPSFHCGVEVEALLAAGLKVRHYNVLESMQADLDDLERRIDEETSAIFLIHYFGFPQPLNEIVSICRKFDLLLIEDCAHALFSEYDSRPLGEFGDISIYSFQKSLPIPDGGGLVVNRPNLGVTHPAHPPARLATVRSALMLWLEHRRMFSRGSYQAVDRLVVRPGRYVLRAMRKRSDALRVPSAGSDRFESELSDARMSKTALSIIDSINPGEVVRSRRDNYKTLKAGLDDLRLPIRYEDLPDGVCPMVLPVFTQNRDELLAGLKARGVETFVFGRKLHPLMPREQFSTARRLSRQNLGLPIHQDLGPRHLDFIIDALASR